MTVLIPAYEPGPRLLELINNIKEKCRFNIVLVDDGSGKAYSDIFRSAKELGCTVLIHATNQGKGRALKTGFAHLQEQGENDGVVCADCDGQHLPEDIIRVAREVQEHKSCIVLGCRRFAGKVPLRSRFGNTVTRVIFSIVTGKRIYDTQTGLRGYSADMLNWLCGIPGERFEYEMIMLLAAPGAGYGFHEVDIDTVYHNNNKSSHFHAVKDSVRVYRPILKFCASSLLSAVLDFALLLIIRGITKNLLLAVIVARACSSLFNYTMNKVFVFSKSNISEMKSSLPKYFTIVIVVMIFNYTLIHLLNEQIGVPLFYAKLLTEATLFIFSYWSQRLFVFRAS